MTAHHRFPVTLNTNLRKSPAPSTSALLQAKSSEQMKDKRIVPKLVIKVPISTSKKSPNTSEISTLESTHRFLDHSRESGASLIAENLPKEETEERKEVSGSLSEISDSLTEISDTDDIDTHDASKTSELRKMSKSIESLILSFASHLTSTASQKLCV